MKTGRPIWALIFLLVVGLPLFAQVTGRVSGTVVDSTGAVIPNVTVDMLLAGGSSPVLTTTTNQDGVFDIAGVRAELYDIRVEVKGFKKFFLRKVKVDPAQQLQLQPIKLEVATTVETVEVVANAQTVQTANAEITTTVSQSQVDNLPVLDRQIGSLFLTQTGVTSGRGPTVINGMRTSMANVTLDGVNIQDNFIRTNALDYFPNKLTIGEVSEFSVNTSNGSVANGSGAAQVILITPSGGNAFHGEGYYYNRNNRLAANDWFNNRDGTEKPGLNLNQIGGRISGPIIKDKLFFFSTYEAYRYKASTPVVNTVLTSAAKSGLITYRSGAAQANVLTLRGLTMNSTIKSIIDSLPAPNSADAGDGLNTSGYRFNARDNETRDSVIFKVDYNLSTKHVLSGKYRWNRDLVDRSDAGTFYTSVPPVYNDNRAKMVSGSWRWTPTPTLTNELMGGFVLSPGNFLDRNKYPSYFLTGMPWTDPSNTFLEQGRATNTYNINNNATWVHRKHTFSFGVQSQEVRTTPFNDGSTIPTFTLGIPTTSSIGLTQTDLPGVSSSDLSMANSLMSSLSGMISIYSQLFNVKDRTSGFIAGQTDLKHWSYGTFSLYASDQWKVLPRLTLSLGLRWDYYTRLNERDSLTLLPTVSGGNYISTLLNPESSLNFAGNSVGRPFYNKYYKNFAPNVGFAWDPFGKGKTSIRAGYSFFYANDEMITAVRNNINTNSGLSSTSADYADATVSSLPSIPVPTFQVPLTTWDNYNINPTGNAVGMPDPNLKTPYVQQWHFSVEHEVKGFILKGHYLGNHMVQGLRAFDYNQINAQAGGFLDDFKRARNNGLLSLAAGKAFDARYNAAIPGSQSLPVFAALPGGGYLTNSTVRSYILSGQAATLANFYVQNGVNGDLNFYANPGAYGVNTVANFSHSTYNAAQFEFIKRSSNVTLQGSYTFSKVLSDATGDGQTRFEPFLDINNPKIERARAPFDLTHVFKLVYDVKLPMGKGKWIDYSPLNRVLEGWTFSGFLTEQSGTPFSVLSLRGTFNRRTGGMTANTDLNKSQLDKVVGYYMSSTGPMFIAASAKGADGRGVASDGTPNFAGQVFTNPTAGNVGALQRRMFNGPWNFSWDAGLHKDTKITEKVSVLLKADFFNILNAPSFYVGNETDSATRFNINQATFGKIIGTFTDRRKIQFGLHLRF